MSRLDVVALIMCVLAAVACSGDDDASAGSNSPPVTQPTTTAPSIGSTPVTQGGPTTALPEGVQPITIRAGEWWYQVHEVRLRPGTVELTFINEGSMRHTFNVKNLDYRNELFNSPTVEPGETKVMQFTVTEPGSYNFYCVMYGHQNKGQEGLLVVQR